MRIRFVIIFKKDGLNREWMEDWFKKDMNSEVFIIQDDNLLNDDGTLGEEVVLFGIDSDFAKFFRIKLELNLRELPNMKNYYMPIAS